MCDAPNVSEPVRRTGMTRADARAATIAERRRQGLDTPSSSPLVKQALVDVLKLAATPTKIAESSKPEESGRGAA